jgi:ABC-type transporter Mla subunit MlaD
MAGTDTRVDILSLEDFRKTLDARLASAQSVLSTLNGKLGNGTIKLGGFAHATSTAAAYQRTHSAHIARIQRLISAIETARGATDTIIRNYSTTEARNKANAADIASVLGGVDSALDGEGQR